MGYHTPIEKIVENKKAYILKNKAGFKSLAVLVMKTKMFTAQRHLIQKINYIPFTLEVVQDLIH